MRLVVGLFAFASCLVIVPFAAAEEPSENSCTPYSDYNDETPDQKIAGGSVWLFAGAPAPGGPEPYYGTWSPLWCAASSPLDCGVVELAGALSGEPTGGSTAFDEFVAGCDCPFVKEDVLATNPLGSVAMADPAACEAVDPAPSPTTGVARLSPVASALS